jgi:hypothetical protein
MERDTTQSLLDEKFPKGANVLIQNGTGSPFNIPRFIVLNDTTIRCNPYGYPAEITFTPSSIEDGDEEGTVIFRAATPAGHDVLVRPAPEAMYDELAEVRPDDTLVAQLQGKGGS